MQGAGERVLRSEACVFRDSVGDGRGRNRVIRERVRTLRRSEGARAKLPSVSNNLISVSLDCGRSKPSGNPLRWARTLGSGKDERELKK